MSWVEKKYPLNFNFAEPTPIWVSELPLGFKLCVDQYGPRYSWALLAGGDELITGPTTATVEEAKEKAEKALRKVIAALESHFKEAA